MSKGDAIYRSGLCKTYTNCSGSLNLSVLMPPNVSSPLGSVRDVVGANEMPTSLVPIEP